MLAVLGMVAVVYSIIEAPRPDGWSARTLAGLAAGGAGILAGFVAWEWRRREPLLDPRVFARRSLSAGSLSIFVQFFALFGFIFIVLQYLQLVRGDSGLLSAVSMLPMAATLMPSARLAPALVARLGAGGSAPSGLALIAAAMAVLAQLTAPAATGCWPPDCSSSAPAWPGHDPGDQRHHLGLAGRPARSRLGDQRPVP